MSHTTLSVQLITYMWLVPSVFGIEHLRVILPHIWNFHLSDNTTNQICNMKQASKKLKNDFLNLNIANWIIIESPPPLFLEHVKYESQSQLMDSEIQVIACMRTSPIFPQFMPIYFSSVDPFALHVNLQLRSVGWFITISLKSFDFPLNIHIKIQNYTYVNSFFIMNENKAILSV